MPRERTRLRAEPLAVFGVPVYGGALIPTMGQEWFVDPNADIFVPKKKWGVGKSEDRPFATLAEALAACNTGDRIYVTGNIREEALIASNLKFDVQIVGAGALHHPDQPSSAYHPGGACIRPPASPTAATSILEVRGRGWSFQNIMFDAPVDASAIKLVRNALSGTSEFDGSHASFKHCRFVDGKYGIEDSGGNYNVTVEDSYFKGFTTTAIQVTSTAVANPLGWKVRRNVFPADVGGFGNASHLFGAFNCAVIRNNIFGTVLSTARYIDLNGGNGNILTENLLMGLYDQTDYRPGTGDAWYQNWTVVKATQSPDGTSILPPA